MHFCIFSKFLLIYLSINRSDVSIVKFDKVKLKCNEQQRLKQELNRLRMKVYRDSRISEVQKEKVRLYDKQRAAARRLKQSSEFR